MAKCLNVFIISLTVLLFIIGCPRGSSPELVELLKPQPSKAELPKIEKTEPQKTALVTTQHPEAELPEAEPENLEPEQVEPEKIESEQINPEQSEPLQSEPEQIEPRKTEPEKTEPDEKTEPEANEPNETEPEEVEPGVDEPNEAELEKNQPPKTEHQQTKPLTVTLRDKCADILNTFVDDKGMVNYRALKRKKQKLNSLLREFDRLKPAEYNAWTKEDKIAFWINAYNIKMLKIIIDNYPIKGSKWLNPLWGSDSIRHIDRNIDGIREQKFIVMDEVFTLAEVEQRIFRKEFDEPRIFLALSHATFSSPPLRNEPYYGPKLYKQLDEQTKKFLSSSRAFVIDRKKKKVHLSAVFHPVDGYGKDFINRYGTEKKFKSRQPNVRAVLSFITNYISRQNVSFLETENYSVKYLNYNWTINE
ncbi:MAG: DUF547 domain-containing protein [Planctomycetota bacterium]